MDQKKAIVVYGASSEQINPKYKEDTFRLGQEIARRGLALICGGGKAGLMKAAIDGATDQGGHTIGVLPEFMVANNWQHPQLTEMISTPDMHTRKRTMAAMSMAAIACPGGCGTFEELMEIITWRQLNLYRGQVVILNTLGYYDPLLQMLGKGIEQGFMRPDHTRLWYVATTPEEAVEMALEPVDPALFTQKIH
ncbi:MAG: TIGR00730 family Rossman fold protein [Bacteroides sp.]|nr:TIGR00730 family Rossman fold protein [Bacteroides sp.]MCM1413831.1 TIGR00730 family Rossman fold protein [Bacteroides sp.]MCM1471225.1 TIGR00730 family Rossman fold protein [Bacteroides sp.]